jgi:hypothetical protein
LKTAALVSMTVAMTPSVVHRLGALADRSLGALDERLIRACSRLGAVSIILLTAAIYVGIGVVLPIAIGADRSSLMLLGALGAACAWAITLA